MALPELFQHRDLFVGCIAISRSARRRSGERIRIGQGIGQAGHVLGATDVAAFDTLGEGLLHPARTSQAGFFSIVAQGYDYPSLARCPALEDDGRCAIHAEGKPVQCEVVPLDPLVPDNLQYLALAGRSMGAAYIGAECIRPGESHEMKNTMKTLVGDGLIHDPAASDALVRRRTMLAMDRELWGVAVFEALREELFDAPDMVARIPVDGFMTISIAPALLAVAGISEKCRQLSLAYIDSQLALIERKIDQALLRRRLDERPATRELRGFADACLSAREVLTKGAQRAPTVAARAARAEAYLCA